MNNRAPRKKYSISVPEETFAKVCEVAKQNNIVLGRVIDNMLDTVEKGSN